MENKIDQFFKEKLESHSLPPSEEAWTKVEASLSKKNNVTVWRIAAALLITGALISVIIWSQLGDKKQDVVVAKKSLKENTIEEQRAPQISQVEKKANSNSSPRSLTSIKKPSITVPQSVSPQIENKSVQKEIGISSVKTESMVVDAEKNKSSFAKASEDKEKINQEATQPAIIASTKQKPIKLEFTLEDFSSEQPVTTVGEEKSSGLKKVWELAREVKNGEGPVREIKNELFALNFKKNKNQ